jgi:hypothetical protein
MDFKEAMKQNITIHWWNFGTKTLDFKGTYEEWFKKQNVKISKINKYQGEEVEGLRFKVPVGSCRITMDFLHTSWYIQNFDAVIKAYASYLGDKTKFNSYNQEYKINW